MYCETKAVCCGQIKQHALHNLLALVKYKQILYGQKGSSYTKSLNISSLN